MNRKVLLTETAASQLQAATDWYAVQSETVAANWFNGLISRLDAIAVNPDQYSVAEESHHLPVQLRQLLYGSGRRITHRVLFEIRETEVISTWKIFDIRTRPDADPIHLLQAATKVKRGVSADHGGKAAAEMR